MDGSPNGVVPVEKLVSAYVKIRNARDAARKEYEGADAKLAEKMDAIKAALLDHCKQNDVESVKTRAGVFYRTLKTRFWTADWEAMNRFILDRGLPEFFEKRLNQGVVKQYLEDNPDMYPPGLQVDREYTITVRKS